MFSAVNTLDKLKKQSDKALGAFQTIVSDLTNSNKQLATEKQSREVSMTKLKEEIETIINLEASNNKVINKINKFLSDED